MNEEAGVVLLEWLCDRVQEEVQELYALEMELSSVMCLYKLGTLCEELGRISDAETNLVCVFNVLEDR